MPINLQSHMLEFMNTCLTTHAFTLTLNEHIHLRVGRPMLYQLGMHSHANSYYDKQNLVKVPLSPIHHNVLYPPTDLEHVT